MSENKTFIIIGSRYADERVEKFNFSPDTVYEIFNENGSCSALVRDLLSQEKFDFSKYPKILTVLNFGQSKHGRE
jgi:hypothetical protein